MDKALSWEKGERGKDRTSSWYEDALVATIYGLAVGAPAGVVVDPIGAGGLSGADWVL